MTRFDRLKVFYLSITSHRYRTISACFDIAKYLGKTAQCDCEECVKRRESGGILSVIVERIAPTTMAYEDEKIRITLSDSPFDSCMIITLASGDVVLAPGIYRRGAWCKHVRNIAKKARIAKQIEKRERHRSHARIDDSELFQSEVKL